MYKKFIVAFFYKLAFMWKFSNNLMLLVTDMANPNLHGGNVRWFELE